MHDHLEVLELPAARTRLPIIIGSKQPPPTLTACGALLVPCAVVAFVEPFGGVGELNSNDVSIVGERDFRCSAARDEA